MRVASMCPGQLPGSTAKHPGPARVSGRGKAVLGTWPRCPPSLGTGRAASESQAQAPRFRLDVNLAPSLPKELQGNQDGNSGIFIFQALLTFP